MIIIPVINTDPEFQENYPLLTKNSINTQQDPKKST